ncbi:MAG: SPFH domain-containing protein [Kiritimatiellia bacterium]|jgi:regulator of protease activity HflC (stomatin/prohibitin superfamily)|nr:SPFH domain-containing protein [Kiritimatiellia bacterium]MDP6810658.1 SPFH domain-containing protein [Kiritimatiellia bacterium]MDP7023744.1 SPFH domain-containing protein [Kiritimatiellia bacterium]
MKSIKALSVIVIAVILGGWLTVQLLTVDIPIGQTGVRIQQYGIFGRKGVVQADFGPGWHRDLGPIDSWVGYDSTVQTLEMTKEARHGSSAGEDDVKVQSVDGNKISLDVTVKYRIAEGMAHKLYADTGAGTKYRAIVRNEAEKACMGRFGQMTTEEFYSPEQKRRRSKEVFDELTASLEDNYIEVIDVLIRNVEFDPKYEAKIRSKKLADQEVELNKSMADAERMSGKTQVIEAETSKLIAIITKEKDAKLIDMEATTDLQIAKIEAQYKKYVTEKTADADLIADQKQAAGQRLVKEAEAEGERLRNEALTGAGGDIMVALEAARNLQIKDVTISTLEVDLLDITGMAEKLGVPAEKE